VSQPETCEDRGYACCALTPPDPTENYAEWYRNHLTAWQERTTA